MNSLPYSNTYNPVWKNHSNISWWGDNNDQFQHQGNQYQGYQGNEQQGFTTQFIPSQGFQQQGHILSSISSLENMMK